MPITVAEPTNLVGLTLPNHASFSARQEAFTLVSELRSNSTYYSVITRAVSRLPTNTHAARQALYDRAAIAFAAELLQDPQVSDEQAAVERRALEGAIRKVERDERKKDFASFFRIFRRQV
jgi:hypothetical protein